MSCSFSCSVFFSFLWLWITKQSVVCSFLFERLLFGQLDTRPPAKVRRRRLLRNFEAIERTGVAFHLVEPEIAFAPAAADDVFGTLALVSDEGVRVKLCGTIGAMDVLVGYLVFAVHGIGLVHLFEVPIDVATQHALFALPTETVVIAFAGEVIAAGVIDRTIAVEVVRAFAAREKGTTAADWAREVGRRRSRADRFVVLTKTRGDGEAA